MRWMPDSVKNRIKDKRNHGGFTVVEVIVVVTILLILAGGIIIGAAKWIEWKNFKRQNEYAKTLYVAAQNQLTEYSSSGQLEDLQDAITHPDGSRKHSIDGGILINSSGEKYGEDIFKGSKDDICYLMGTEDTFDAYMSGDYSSIEKNAGMDAIEIKALYDLLIDYVYDPSILRAAICVEFTPENGQVFSVLYSDISSEFEYNAASASRRGCVDVADRTTSVRKKRMVGYYGVDSLSVATSINAEKPTIVNAKLNNEDTLNLSFTLGRVKEALKLLTYEISVYDSEWQEETKVDPLLIFSIRGSDIGSEEEKKTVTCKVTRYNRDEEGKPSIRQEIGEYEILAWIDEDDYIRVVLDAVDLDATSALFQSNYSILSDVTGDTGVTGEFKKTYSFHRFGVDVDNIYCKISGRGNNYNAATYKTTNIQHAYMGSVQKAKDGSVDNSIYTVKNARHLYNIRYMEDYSEDERRDAGMTELAPLTYQLTEDISWEAFQENDVLFRNGEVQEEADFPSLKQLRMNSVFESGGNKKHTVSGLTITEESNHTASIYDNGSENCPTGLFVENHGTLRNFGLDKITVEGSNAVGAFCGENHGSLDELIVYNSEQDKSPSNIKGINNVGGIVGAQAINSSYTSKEVKRADKTKIEYKSLINRAEVIGTRYTGGIVGQLKADEHTSVLVEDCKNYGIVQGTAIDEVKNTSATTARFLGGIVGYCENSEYENAKNLIIRNCSSSPQYVTDTIEIILKNENNELTSKLNGVYVGGIVGYNKDALIENCNTKKERTKEGYIFGYQYVGGIVGFNESQAGALDGDNSVNEANIIGHSYVGGICGINSGIDDTASEDIIVPDEQRDESKKILNWINKGIVAAAGDFVGGITGYNSGVIVNCRSAVASSDTAKKISQAESIQGDYAGGIAGYNNGIIAATESNVANLEVMISSVSYISGKNYVGGIVGYNDVNAEIRDYEISGGYVLGSGAFTGGFAGLNFSEQLLENRIIQSHPNRVEGEYCVGGTIGGNIVAIDDDLQTQFNTNNFLGNISGKAFVGGYSGYNHLIDGEDDTSVDSANAENVAEKLIEILGGENQELTYLVQQIADMERSADEIQTDKSLIISGLEEGSDQLVKFGNIKGEIYVGGVIGYNEQNTCLTIRDVVNKTPVEATAAIENEQEQDSDKHTYLNEKYQYSYAGGIIGKVSQGVIVENCSNQDVGDVVAVGTYLGGIAEINEGVIRNCTVSSIGNSNMDYVGGIAGLNKSGAVIEECIFSNRAITGNNYVGGITAENYGVIRNLMILSASVNAAGLEGYVGGISGYSYDDSLIVLDASSQTTIYVNASGNYIGGIIGYNAGSLEKDASSENDKFVLQGSVAGNQNVGGFVGRNTGTLRYMENHAVVTAENGGAGGIVGTATGSIEDCINEGVVSASKTGDAGGIVSYNEGNVIRCKDMASIEAVNGNSGGIAGVNGGTIMECVVEQETLVFRGFTNSGGITGINNDTGTIEASVVNNIKVTNLDNSSNSNIGAVAGTNRGTINMEQGSVENCTVASYSSASNLGGVSGYNEEGGTISGADVNDATIEFEGSSAVYANMGGVSGTNEGKVVECKVDADIIGYMGNSDYGYGGIAGVNNQVIVDCVFDGKLTADGSADNIVNMGGIAGRNNTGGSIVTSYIGVEKNTLITSGNTNKNSAFGYVGGLVGWNYGSVTDCDNYSVSSNAVKIVNYAGNTGGIVGYQAPGAVVSGSANTHITTGEKWSVTSEYFSNDSGTGGIIGYSASGQDIYYADNYASVMATATNADNVAAAGMIGRLENKESNVMTISAFNNYGNISGVLSGGLIARLKYKGLRIEDCNNYGKIEAKASGYGSGIVATFYAIDAGSAVDFIRCKNFGNVSATNGMAGGIGGHVNTLSVVPITYSDCVNEGCINAKTAGGISAIGTQASYYRCRNYGYSSNANFGGITTSGYKIIQDCVNIGTPRKLTTGTGTIKNSYFLGKGSGSEEVDDGTVYLLRNTPVVTNGVINNSVENLFSSLTDRFVCKKDSDNVYVKFNFSDAPALTNFGVYWANGNINDKTTVRQYKFRVSCNGASKYLAEDGSWTTNSSEAYQFTAYGTAEPEKSYWSTDFNDGTEISDISLHVDNVNQGTITSEGVYTTSGNTVEYVCLFAVSAYNGSEEQTATSKDVYSAIEKITDAENEVDKTEPLFEELQEVWVKSRYKSDWIISAGGNQSGNDAKNVFNNLVDKESWTRAVWSGVPKSIIMKPATATGEKVNSFRICWAGKTDAGNIDDSKVVRDYTYEVKITYTDNTVKSRQYQASGTYWEKGQEQYADHSELIDAEKYVKQIELKVISVKQGQSSNNYICIWGIDIGDKVPEKLDIAYQKAKINYDSAVKELADAQAALLKAQYYTGSIKNAGICLKKPEKQTEEEESSYGTVAWASLEKGKTTYCIVGEADSAYLNLNISELTYDPQIAWSDTNRTYEYASSATISDKGNRQLVYEDVDPKIVSYYKSGEEVAEIKEPIQLSNIGGALAITWTHKSDNYYADQVVYRVVKDEKILYSNYTAPITVSYGVESYGIRISEEWNGATIFVNVRAIGGMYDEESYDVNVNGPDKSAVQEYTSKWISASLTLKQAQAVPKIHLELAAYGVNGNRSNGEYVAILENPEDFIGDRKTSIVVEIVNDNNSVAHTLTINEGKARSSKFSMNIDGNKRVRYYAKANNAYVQSVVETVQSALYGGIQLKTYDYITSTFNDFYGDRVGNMFNQAQMKNSKDNTEMYVNSEIVVQEYQFKIPDENGSSNIVFECDLAVSYGNSHVTARSGTMTSNLNNLPRWLLNYGNIVVRTYPWQNQNFACWYGHPVVSGISESELLDYLKNRTLIDVNTGRTDTNVFTESGFANGYVLRLNQNNTYDIIYSGFLAFSSEYEKQIDQKVYTVDQAKRKVVSGTKYEKDIEPQPIIEAIEKDLMRPEENIYTFQWDKGNADEDAVYDIQLYGVDTDGTQLLLDSKVVNASIEGSYVSDSNGDNYWTYRFEDSNENWNYVDMMVSVTRVGEMDAQGKTSVFPASSEYYFKVLQRLSQISRPTVALHEEDDIVEKNSLVYDVTWNTVPEIERSDVKEYEITVEQSENDEKTEFHYDDKENFDAALNKWQTLYEGKTDAEPVIDGNTIVYTWYESVYGAAVNKKVTLSWNSSSEDTFSGTIIKKQESVWIYTVQDSERSLGSITKMLDLNDYERGQILELSIRAKAIEDSDTYRDGLEGVPREFALPERLIVPDIANLTGSPQYSSDSFMTTEEFSNDSITLSMFDDETNAVQGQYQIAVAVYENAPDNEEDSIKHESDEWSDTARAVLISKDSNTFMSGEFGNAYYNLRDELETDYAGMWLKIAMRSVSDSNISSMWTDEDESTDGTKNYQWIRIPRVQIDEPKFTQEQTTVFYDILTGDWSFDSHSVEDAELHQITLSFENQKHADGYRIERIRNGRKADFDETKNYKKYDVDWIYLEASGNETYNVLYQSTDIEKIADINAYSYYLLEDGTPIYHIGTIKKGDVIRLPYTEQAVGETDGENISAVSCLEWTADDNFRLILPDENNENGYVSKVNTFTSQCSVQATTILGERYEKSKISSWYCYSIATEQIDTEIITLDFDAAPISPQLQLEKSGYEGFAYQITAKARNWLIYEIRVLDGAGNVMDDRYLSAYGDGQTDIDTLLSLSEENYGSYEGYYISVRVAAIELAGGSVSEWSEWMTFPEPLEGKERFIESMTDE